MRRSRPRQHGPAEKIIARFGGLTATARALGHRNPTTVQGWINRGFVPARQQRPVLAAAQAHGLDITPADFIDNAARAAE